MRKSALAAAITLLLLPALLPALPASAASDWVVYGTVSLEDTSRLQEGSVVVKPGAVLTISNATLSFNLSQEGGFALQVESGGSLVMRDCTIRSAQPGLHYNFLVNGRLEVSRCDISGVRGDFGLGGIEITGGDALIEDSVIHHSKYYGLFIRSGSPTVRRTTIDTQAVAISVLPGASPTIEDVVIRNSTSIGLKISSATPAVRNLTVLGSSNFAIGAISSTLDIQRCTVSGGAVGVDAVESTGGRVEGCQFTDVGTGVRAQDSPVAVSNSTFVTVTTGVNATRSAVEVTGSSFSQFGVGVRAAGPVDGVYGGLATDNSFCGPGTAFQTERESFYIGQNTFCPDVTSVRVLHVVTLEVRAPGDTVAQAAIVEVTDAQGVAVFNGATDSDGRVSAPLEEYRTLPNGQRQNRTPHNVRINYQGQVTVTAVNATSETTIRITLAKEDEKPPFAITREGLFFVGAVFALAAAVSSLVVWRASRRRKEEQAEASRRARARHGPRRGR